LDDAGFLIEYNGVEGTGFYTKAAAVAPLLIQKERTGGVIPADRIQWTGRQARGLPTLPTHHWGEGPVLLINIHPQAGQGFPKSIVMIKRTF